MLKEYFTSACVGYNLFYIMYTMLVSTITTSGLSHALENEKSGHIPHDFLYI